MKKKILLLNGPNLSTLGKRNVEIYGRATLNDIVAQVREELALYQYQLVDIQSDAESDLIHALQVYADSAGAIVNPGALMIAGWGFRDALENYSHPWIEVHISNIAAREQFRHHSILTSIASGMICGLGSFGYTLAAKALNQLLNKK